MHFTPAVYEHAAKIIGKTPWEVSRSKELIVQGHAEAYRAYRHTPIVVGIDIYNLEAEAYGSVVEKPEGYNIPSISNHLCEATDEIPDLPPFDPAKDGRIAMFIEAACELKELFPEADVKVPVSGPFSLASNLTGFDNLLCDCLTDPDSVSDALEFLIEGQLKFVEAIHKTGIGVTFFESSATPPLVSPDMFRDMILPALKRFLDRAAEITGTPCSCIIGGDTAPIIDYLMETKPGYVIAPGETDQALFLEKMENYPDVMVRVNMDPAIICSGKPEKVFAEADRVYALANRRQKACIGSGVLPYEAEPETVLELMKYIAAK